MDCYVLEADVPGKGEYAFWLDPIHDFHIVRMRVRREAGDMLAGQKLKENMTHTQLFEVLEFEKVDTAWMPKYCKVRRITDSPHYHVIQQSEITISEILLNPDHEKRGSFEPNDIPNGTQGYIPPSVQPLIWQDGHLMSAEVPDHKP